MKILFKIMVNVFVYILLVTGTGIAQDSGRTIISVWPPKAVYPIAVVEFKNLDGKSDINNVSKQMAEIISNDLDFTGLFKILDPASFLENPQRSGITEQDIDFQSWSVIGAQSLVKGGFSQTGNQITIEARLFDVNPPSFRVGRRYIGTKETLRKIAHKFSNQIYSALTGESGIFETQLAFVKQEKQQKEVYTMDYDGYNERRFSYHGTITLSPRWSPDGNWIAFTSYKGGSPNLVIKDLITRKEYIASPYRQDLNISPDWSPDGSEIALTLKKDGNPEIYVMDRQGKAVRRLTNDRGIDVSPSWSPDGQKIAFVSNRAGTPQIYTMDRYGGNVQRITFEGQYNSEPDWSPRGDKLAYSSQMGSFQICTINPDGTGNIQLTWEGSNESPKWSSDGLHIVFTSTRIGGKNLYAMLANGTNVKQITKGGTNYSPSWSPSLP
jgi:tol-pal system beta propeller repeat protein TolB